jgi:hypothetical protein
MQPFQDSVLSFLDFERSIARGKVDLRLGGQGSSKTCSTIIAPRVSFARSQAYWSVTSEFGDKSVAAKIVRNFNEWISLSLSVPTGSSRDGCADMIEQFVTLLQG